MRLFRIIAILLFVCCPTLAQSSYSVLDLGNLGLSGTSFPDRLNDAGLAIGKSYSNVSHPLGFLSQSNGSMIPISASAFATLTWVHGLNNGSDIVGEYYETNLAPHAFVKIAQQSLTELPILESGTYAIAKAINSNGIIVGFSNRQYGEAYTKQAVSWTFINGSWEVSNRHGINWDYDQSWANNINASNSIVGGMRAWNPDLAVGFILNGNNSTILPNPPGWYASYNEAMSISNNGSVAGYAKSNTGNTIAWVWTPTSYVIVAPNVNHRGTGFLDITDGPVAVGFLQNMDLSQAAMLWNPIYGLIDLNTVVPVGTMHLRRAVSINRYGQILCQGVDGAGGVYALRLTPIPVPN